MIRDLLDENSLIEMLLILKQLRVDIIHDRFHEVFFSNLLPIRRIIYPFEYLGEAEVILALESAMQAVQEVGCYIDAYGDCIHILPNRQRITTSRYCYISLDQFVYAMNENGINKELVGVDDFVLFPVDWSMYSVQKQWGLYVDMNRFAVLAGTEEFMSAFNQKYPSTERSIEEFLIRWRGDYRHEKENLEADWNWLTRLMIHVYGKEQAFNLMDQFKMFDS